ncbi:hypothetical protein SBRCBS47491_000243 [Sporothrix bragantina]|uniref:FHA domain-containing protein n=1 Tax=Sporothrix bragantina TaxID=671064 RepID=A0ABP0ANN0_9PEZI
MSPERDDVANGYETITVSLTPTGPNTTDGKLVRRITLTSSNPKINVGRASKTVSKGLIPEADNAFFESPVVSRVHAEIAANFEDGTVSVTDLGSLHGTSINDSIIEKNVATPLEEDDKVSFGIHVSRGLDVFHPTACKVALSRTIARPAERARSYCAPDSEDSLSDGSDCDCSSVHEDDINCNADPTASIAQNIDNAANAFIAEAPELGDTTMGREADSSSDSSESESDFGEVESIEETEMHLAFDSNTGYLESSEDSSDYEEDDDIPEDEDEGDEEEDEEEEDEEEVEDGDAEGDFLERELKNYDARSVSLPPFQNPDIPSGGESLPVNGLWTPPSVSADDLATGAASMKDENVEAASGDFTCLGDSLIDPTPRTTTVKCDISSILNPSPPSSSPPKHVTANDGSLPEPVVCLDTQEVLDATASWGVLGIPALLSDPSVDDEPRMTSALANSQEGIFVSPTVADIASRMGSFEERAESAIQHSKASFMAQESPSPGLDEAAREDTLLDALLDDVLLDKVEKPASTRATMFSKLNMVKSNRKRKVEEMTVGTEVTPLSNEEINGFMASALFPPEEPAAKRQATPAAVAATRKTKGRMWAAAEKIGIAALGGAVVLGSLIYTAPSF